MQSLWDCYKEYLTKPDPLSSVRNWGDWEDPEYLRKNNYGWHKRFGLDAGVLEHAGHPKITFDQVVWTIREILWWTATGTTEQYVHKLDNDLGAIAGIITTNYDVLPELLVGSTVPLRYGFKSRTRCVVEDASIGEENSVVIKTRDIELADETFPILKIHGGVNLALCPRCHQVIEFPLTYGGISETEHAPTPLWYFAWDGAYYLGRVFHDCQPVPTQEPQRREARLQPLVAPPMTNKQDLDYWHVLRSLQESALDLIEQCDRVAIIGSAMRPSDTQLLEIIGHLHGKELVLYGSDSDLTRLRELLPRSSIDFRGWFLDAPPSNITELPIWGLEPTKEFGEDNPTPEWLKKRHAFDMLMAALRRSADFE